MFGFRKNSKEVEFEDLADKSRKSVKGLFSSISFKDFFSGSLFQKEFFLRQYKLIGLIVVLMFCYVGNRYGCEERLAEIDRLNKKLEDVKFDALTRSAELLGISRQSQVQEIMRRHDSTLLPSKIPPFRIKLD